MYVVDSNFFIQAHRAIYPIGIATSFWSKVEELANSLIIESIDKVQRELWEKEDEIKNWCEAKLPSDFFKDSSPCISDYIAITQWAQSKSDHYKQHAIQVFLETELADSWLVGYCKKENKKVVTYEKSEPLGKKRIKIPEVCNAFGVPFLNTIEMLRELGESF